MTSHTNTCLTFSKRLLIKEGFRVFRVMNSYGKITKGILENWKTEIDIISSSRPITFECTL